MDKAVACCDDEAPGNLGIRSADIFRNVSGGLSDQLQVAYLGVVVESAGNEPAGSSPSV
jgi:hypothetical protein